VRPLPVARRSRAAVPDRTRLRLLVEHCLDAEGAAPETGLGVVLAGDRLQRRLNHAWRGIDRVTDVLSFPSGEEIPRPAGGEAEERLAGEVVISLPQCLRQAAERGETPGREFVRLLVHGLLHCLGYDHERPADRARMTPRERRYRAWAERNGISAGILRVPGRGR